MKFEANNRRKAIDYEKDLVVQWKQNKTFEKSVQQRNPDNSYVFYDGPPFITGSPHHGTLLSSVVKDAIPRYQTMLGKRVERVWGWDCHGLPAENFVEKKLGITDRHDIGTKISLEDYITTARESMVQTSSEWEDTVDRIGRWVEFKGAYKTMDKDYMESVWWAFKQLYDKGKIYAGERVLMYDTKWATPLSKAEVTMDAGAYQVVTDPSVYVKFRLLDETSVVSNQLSVSSEAHTDNRQQTTDNIPVYLLAWTTTPWTLPGNTAVAVNKTDDYTQVRLEDGTNVILATKLLDKVLTDEKHNVVPYEKVQQLKGAELVGRHYEPLFEDRGENAHRIWHADYVSMDDGTGIVHLAPAYGEEDFVLAQQNHIPIVHVLDEYGMYTEGPWHGEEVWTTNKRIAREMLGQSQNESQALRDKRQAGAAATHNSELVSPDPTAAWQGAVWKIEYIQHEYPHNLRNGNRLMYRAHPSWFMDIDGQRTEMLEQNENVTWFPEHIKHGRFAKTVQQAPDWNLSRDRFWATAMPVWKGVDADGAEHIKVVGSYAELKELSGVELDDYHRPWVDDIEFDLDGIHYQRIDKVLDCWFESGSMPFAQFHYPFENKEKFEANYPGDFIVEYVGQVRAWFYYVHAVNTALFGQNAYKNVIVTGNVAGNDGFKMSKSRGNFTDPNTLFDEYSVDAWRFLMLSSSLLKGEDFALKDKEVQDVQRKLAMIWNMYDFFTLYASVDGWEWHGDMSDPLTPVVISTEVAKSPQGTGEDLSSTPGGSSRDDRGTLHNPLDRWVLSRLHQLQQNLSGKMDSYDVPGALEQVLPFLDDASNWYVRRSRRRFWRSAHENDERRMVNDEGAATDSLSVQRSAFQDKQDAYTTLHYLLVRLSIILAPFVPFLAEELYQKLTGGESVHLLDWPPLGAIDETLVEQMAQARELINQGLSLRAANRLKVRQPLASATLHGFTDMPEAFQEIIVEELNVKAVQLAAGGESDLKTELDMEITPELKREGLMRELIRQVQTARKAAGLNVDDRITLSIVSEAEEVQTAVTEHAATIVSETLAVSLNTGQPEQYSSQVTVDSFTATIALAVA